MAEFQALRGSQSIKHNEILRATGDFPYLMVNAEGPETAGVADVLNLVLGDLLKIDSGTGKIARYETGDLEPIIGICAEEYNSTQLNLDGAEAGYIDMYIAGSLIKGKCFMDDGAANRIAVDTDTMIKARQMGLFLL